METMEIFNFIANFSYFFWLILVIFIFIAFIKNRNEFAFSFSNIFTYIFNFLTFVFCPNIKGFEFIDKYISTSLLRLPFFGLNAGFIELGKLYSNYFNKVLLKHQNGENFEILPQLESTSLIISSFKTKQFISFVITFFILNYLLYFLFSFGLFTVFLNYLSYFKSFSKLPVSDQFFLIFLLAATIIVFFSYICIYVSIFKKMIDIQSRLNTKELKDYLNGELEIILKSNKHIDDTLAEEAKAYTIATFLKV